MEYQCDVCGKVVKGDSVAFIGHHEKHIVEVIKSKNPGWQEKDGMCPKCLEYYRAQMTGE